MGLRWLRVGQQATGANSRDPRARSLLTDLYAVGGISTSPESADFRYMFDGSTPIRYTREEFDWFIAVNAFDYTISQVVVVNQQTGEAQVHYQIHIADEYAWYSNAATGLVDTVMGQLDMGGWGEAYELIGTSSINSLSFNANEILIDDSWGSVTGTPGQPYYRLAAMAN